MLYEFRSRATGSVTMIGKAAEQVLKIIGKSPDATGIITVAHRTPMTRTFRKTPASASSACVSASIR